MKKRKHHKKLKTKIENEIIHFKKRMIERHNLVLNKEQINEICNLITTGRSIFVRKQSNRIVIHDVIYDNKTMRIVYDKIRKVPVTVYDDSWIHEK